MNFSTCCCAPAPIDIIDTTAATPKIIPSIVSSERSLCDHQRLQASPAVGEDLEAGAFREPGGDRRHRPAPGIGPEDEAVFARSLKVSGFTSATSASAGKSFSTTRFSVTRTICTASGLNPAPSRT